MSSIKAAFFLACATFGRQRRHLKKFCVLSLLTKRIHRHSELVFLEATAVSIRLAVALATTLIRTVTPSFFAKSKATAHAAGLPPSAKGVARE